MHHKNILLFFLLLFCGANISVAQDTLSISFEEFLEVALQNSGQMKFENTKVAISNNAVQQAKDQRILPSLNFRSEHALVPGVTSPNGFDEESIYLDPDAKNDWNNFGLYTRLRITGIQPVFTWGAVGKAIDAAEIAVKATEQEYETTKSELELRLYDLYYSYVLALEIERLLNDADDKIGQIERALNKQLEENPNQVDESDEYKFKVFKATFGIQKEEVIQNLSFIKETWKYVLRNENDNIFEPVTRFLDAYQNGLNEIAYYQNSATINRPELRRLEFGKEALERYIDSKKAANLPGLFFGFTTTFASTPIRPRQPNPFISTPENTFNTAFGFTIRQNLNFLQAKTGYERSRLEVKRLDFLKSAAQDGVILEVNDAYRNAAVAEVKIQKTDEALKITKEWLRMEQLDYDFGEGEVKDLIDAMKQELELRLSEKQSIFEYNAAIAKLNKSAGLPLTVVSEN